MFTLLIAEDDALIRGSLCRDFPWKEWGFELLGSAANGKECLKMAQQMNPDAVLTDIRMPQLDGISLLEQLRANPEGAEVVLLSAYDEFRYAQKGINLGAFAYVLKMDVFDEIEDVMHRLHAYLTKKHAIRTLIRDEYSASEPHYSDAVQFALQYTADHLNEGPTASEIARRCNLSANYFSQRFRQETGMTYVGYVKSLRLQRAQDLLTGTRISLDKVAQETGFQSVQYFCRFFRGETGETPGAYRKRIRKENQSSQEGQS